MKKYLQILVVFVLSFNLASAQWITDSVSMGPGYSNNIFYALGSAGGIQKTEPSHNWHIAFSMNAMDSASVFANHHLGNEFVKVFNIHRPISDWNNAVLGDTATADLLYNGNQGWYQGAFNDIANPSAFNYGWGTYNLASHLIQGDSMFIVRAGANYYKFAIDSLNPITYDWYFKVQKIDLTSMTIPYTISKNSGFTNRMFAYFNLDSAASLDREPDVKSWDFQLMTFPQWVQAGPTAQLYGVTGALTNRGIASAKAQSIDVDVALTQYPTNVAGWEKNPISTIGADWKMFNMSTNIYEIEDSLSYFVSAQNDSVYQLQFLSFGGGSTGNMSFRYRPVGSSPLTVQEFKTLGEIKMYPNPASDKTNFLFNASKNTTARLVITALNGQTMLNSVRTINAGLNAWELNTSNLPTGNYIISLQNDSEVLNTKLTVIK